MSNTQGFDLVVVGAGIVGLSVALAGRRRGYRVLVVERNSHAVGASVRNFGFVTVTGQRRGGHWRRAMRSQQIWQEIAARSGVDIVHQGLAVVAHRPEAAEVLHEFKSTEMGEDCEFLTIEQARQKLVSLRQDVQFEEIMYSPHELRVESAHAIPQLAAWLAEQGVSFWYGVSAHDLQTNGLMTSQGAVQADRVVLCPGDNYGGPLAQHYHQAGLSHCTLQMLRIETGMNAAIDCGLMSDLSLVRYEGYAELPAANALMTRLKVEKAEHLMRGIHLIAVRSADGTLVVGDSHEDASAPLPFADEHTDSLILGELQDCLDLPSARIVKRWVGSYAKLAGNVYQLLRPAANVRSIIVTGGTGASTGPALGEDVLADLEGEIHMDEAGTEA